MLQWVRLKRSEIEREKTLSPELAKMQTRVEIAEDLWDEALELIRERDRMVKELREKIEQLEGDLAWSRVRAREEREQHPSLEDVEIATHHTIVKVRSVRSLDQTVDVTGFEIVEHPMGHGQETIDCTPPPMAEVDA